RSRDSRGGPSSRAQRRRAGGSMSGRVLEFRRRTEPSRDNLPRVARGVFYDLSTNAGFPVLRVVSSKGCKVGEVTVPAGVEILAVSDPLWDLLEILDPQEPVSGSRPAARGAVRRRSSTRHTRAHHAPGE